MSAKRPHASMEHSAYRVSAISPVYAKQVTLGSYASQVSMDIGSVTERPWLSPGNISFFPH